MTAILRIHCPPNYAKASVFVHRDECDMLYFAARKTPEEAFKVRIHAVLEPGYSSAPHKG